MEKEGKNLKEKKEKRLDELLEKALKELGRAESRFGGCEHRNIEKVRVNSADAPLERILYGEIRLSRE